MLKYLQHKYALSKKGATDMVLAIFSCAVQNIIFMFPVSLLYFLVKDLLNGEIKKEKIIFYIAGIFICLILIFLSSYFEYNATYFATYKESGKRRIALAEKLRKLPLSFFGKRDLADLTSVIMGDCAYIEQVSSHYIPQLIGSFISTFIIAVYLFIYNWQLALASLWVLPAAFSIVIFSRKAMHLKQKKQMAVTIECADGIQECLETVRDLKSNNAQEKYLEGLNKKIRAVEKQTIATEIFQSIYNGSARMVLKLGIATTALAGGIMLSNGAVSLLTFFMFLLVVSRLYDPLTTSLDNLSAVLSADVHCERMDEILSGEEQTGAEFLSNSGYTVEFKNVSFSYNSNEQVLKDVSFTAKQGEVTALIGPSGGGKTTISRLAARFWDINSGKITVGGMDISKTDPETLMSLYSIVFQDVVLFNNTVKENIRIGRKNASDEEVLAAAKLANCDEFVKNMANGYNTLIGENGCELSGGERQRISIARAFLKDAPIILLDEATASLDVENESLIQTSLSNLIKNKTVLIIAHRMRTVSGADKIVVLKDGIVAEQGSPAELIKSGGIYCHMAEIQKQSESWNM
ncbi:MAG: ABC transporter ATP-binding protein/permease [Clostridiales bacterium]|nr:ABC transporter ATP-binding protein/permease [Clostridiales bacterium]